MSGPVKYRKRPVVIEAMQLTDDASTDLVLAWVTENGGRAVAAEYTEPAVGGGNAYPHGGQRSLLIHTRDGSMWALLGDYVIREPHGTEDRTFYPCKPSIFAATYELIGDPAVSPVESDARHDLPGWDDMSDLDRGAALLHLHKRRWEGVEYAIEEYPVRYFDHPGLLNLDPEEACDHAASLADREAALPPEERERLCDAALDADRACLRAEMGLS